MTVKVGRGGSKRKKGVGGCLRGFNVIRLNCFLIRYFGLLNFI
jgi:hypothetical protein